MAARLTQTARIDALENTVNTGLAEIRAILGTIAPTVQSVPTAPVQAQTTAPVQAQGKEKRGKATRDWNSIPSIVVPLEGEEQFRIKMAFQPNADGTFTALRFFVDLRYDRTTAKGSDGAFGYDATVDLRVRQTTLENSKMWEYAVFCAERAAKLAASQQVTVRKAYGKTPKAAAK